MKIIRAIWPALAVVLLLGGCEKPVYIHAQIENLPDGTVFLVRYADGVVERIDSTASVAGRFSFRQPGPLPAIYYIWFGQSPADFFPVAVEGSELTVSGDLNVRDGVTVSGSPGNDALAELRRVMQPYEVKIRALRLALDGLDPGGSDSLAYRAIEAKQDSVKRLIRDANFDFVRSHRDNIVSAFLISMALDDSLARHEAASLADELDPAMPDNAFLEKIRQRRAATP